MSKKGIKNVLVLGIGSVRISLFCKLFEVFLSYDSYEETVKWEINLEQNDGKEQSIYCVNNLRLMCTPKLDDSYISKQIISILANFQEQQSLSAIIILLKPNEKNNIYLLKLKSVLFRDLNVSNNILYVYAIDNNFHFVKQQFSKFVLKKKNMFNYNENSFYECENWLETKAFFMRINNYIVGVGDNNGLGTIYIRTEVSKELLLNLINNLLELLIRIYICLNVQYCISDYKKNVVACHGNQCVTWNQYNAQSGVLYLKSPKICHASCKCETDGDVSKCSVFDKSNKTCMQCNCKMEFHSTNYLQVVSTTNLEIEQEKLIVIQIIATFDLFKKSHEETLDLKKTFCKFLDLENPQSKAIFAQFNHELCHEVEQLKDKGEAITKKNVIISLKSLYEIKKSAEIIPQFIEDIFPEDIRFEAVGTPCKNMTIKTMQVEKINEEIQILKNRVTALERQIGNVNGGT